MSIAIWSRSASRVVRPFFSYEQVKHLLDSCELRVERDGDFSDKDSISIKGIDRNNLGIAVKIPILSEDIVSVVSIEPEELRVIVTIDDKRMKRNECVLCLKLEDLDDEPRELSEKTIKRFAWWGGSLDLNVALVLAKDLEESPGKPFRKGHWIAKKAFSFNSTKDNPIFPISKKTGEEFKKFNLPSDTVCYVSFNCTSLNIPFDEFDTALEVWVHEDVFNNLFRNEASNLSKIVSNMLKSEIITCIMTHALQNHEDDEHLLKNGVLETLADKLERETGCNFKKLKEFSKERGQPGLRAVVQSYCNLKKTITNA